MNKTLCEELRETANSIITRNDKMVRARYDEIVNKLRWEAECGLVSFYYVDETFDDIEIQVREKLRQQGLKVEVVSQSLCGDVPSFKVSWE